MQGYLSFLIAKTWEAYKLETLCLIITITQAKRFTFLSNFFTGIISALRKPRLIEITRLQRVQRGCLVFNVFFFQNKLLQGLPCLSRGMEIVIFVGANHQINWALKWKGMTTGSSNVHSQHCFTCFTPAVCLLNENHKAKCPIVECQFLMNFTDFWDDSLGIF